MRPASSIFLYSFLNYLGSAFFIRSFVPPNSKCNSTLAFLDECFEARVGKCDAASVAKVGVIGYRQALSNCHAKDGRSSNEGAMPFIGAPNNPNFPTSVQLVSSLGYLQTQCSLSKSKNCSSEHVHNIMAQCEEQMKPLAGYPQYDRHRLLRIKMDTSRKLLMYEETDRERECLVVRSTLSELYTLHHANCYHSLVTRCLCERLRFNIHCGIDCDQLEATSPDQDTLAWDEWKEARLIHTNFSSQLTLSLLILILILTFSLS